MTAERSDQLKEAFRIAVSLVIVYGIGLLLRFPAPKNGAIAIAVTSLATVGESWHKGLLRIVGTTIGAAAGLVFIMIFAQSRWGMMGALAGWLVFVAYNIQSTRYAYAWLMVGMTTFITWASSYQKVDQAFDAALWRTVETANGVAVYTVVQMLLWPSRAGPAMKQLGRKIVEGFRDVVALAGEELGGKDRGAESAAAHSALAGQLAAFGKQLVAAIADTADVRRRATAWRGLQSRLASVERKLQLFELSVRDANELDLPRLLPGLPAALDVIRKRLDRAFDPGPEEPIDLSAGDLSSLSHVNRAQLMNVLHRTRGIDEAARGLCELAFALYSGSPASAAPDERQPRPSRWDPERFLIALAPAVFFIATYLIWIYLYPPTGPSLTIVCSIFGLMVTFVPMNLFQIVKLLVLGILVASPIYMFVMPRIETWWQLATVVFASGFLLGLLRGKLAPLRTLGLVTFAITTGIVMRQSYSIFGVLFPAIMLALGTCIVMAIYWFFTPMRPEKMMLRNVRRFFRGCARVMAGFATPGHRGWWLRRRAFRSQVLLANQRIGMAQPSLDYKLFPANDPDKVTRLRNAVQGTVYRLAALEDAYETFRDRSEGLGERESSLREVRPLLERVFRRWSRQPGRPAFEEERAELDRLGPRIKAELDELLVRNEYDEALLEAFWAMLGSLQGLMDQMEETQASLDPIDWDQWALVRF
ncbi:MAG: FUSC family protein [Planctomycetota bacterium]|jgi:uncharacterized membrane protein YccC